MTTAPVIRPRTFLTATLLVAILTAPAAPGAAVFVGEAGVTGLFTAVAADADDVWVMLSIGEGRLRVARFSAAGSLERELVLGLADATLNPWLLAVDRHGRLWLQARSVDAEATEEGGRTWAVAFSPGGRLVARHDLTGWRLLGVSPDGEVYATRGGYEQGPPELAFARVDTDGVEPLASLPVEEYFGPAIGCSGEQLAVAPLTGGRFAVLRTWGSDGWLSIYDAGGTRLSRWPFRSEWGQIHSLALAAGPGLGVTVADQVYFDQGPGQFRTTSFDSRGRRLSQALLPGETDLQLAPARSGGFWAHDAAGTLRRLSPALETTAVFDVDPPPDGVSWPEHAARRRELARLPADAPAERWLDALLLGDQDTSRRATEWFVAQGASVLPLLLEERDPRGKVWPIIERVLASDPAASAAALAHLAGAGRETRLAFAAGLGDALLLGPEFGLESYRDFLEDVYLSGEDGEWAAGRALHALAPSQRLVAHQIEQVLGHGRSPHVLRSILARFPAVATALEAGFASSPDRRERSVAVLHWLLDELARRSPAEAPRLEQELREWSRRWASRPEPEVALAAGLLVLATGDASELPRLAGAALAKGTRVPAEAAILRLLRFFPEELDEPAVDSLLEVLHCEGCRQPSRLEAAIRAVLGGDDLARALDTYHLLPPDEPLPEHLVETFAAEFPRWSEADLLAFLDEPRLRALAPSFHLAAFLDRVHRFAAHRPGIQRAVRELFLAVFTREAIRSTLPDADPRRGFLDFQRRPVYGHWLGALEPAVLHGLMDIVPEEVLAAVQAPPDLPILRRARMTWGVAQYVEKSGRRAPERLREWAAALTVPLTSTHAPPEPPGLQGLLQRLDRAVAYRSWRWVGELGADPGELETELLTRLDHPSAITRARARVLLAEIGSAPGRDIVLRETDAALALGDVPAAHLLAAIVLHGEAIPTAALELASGDLTELVAWSDGLTPLATDRLARHLRDRVREEPASRATGAVRLLGALHDDLADDFVVNLATHHPDVEVRAAAREVAAARAW